MDEARSNNNAWSTDQGRVIAATTPGDPASQVPDATLWTNSFFVAITGGTTLEVIKGYVENQRNV